MKQWAYVGSLLLLLLSLAISCIDILTGLLVGLVASIGLLVTASLIIKDWNNRE